MLVTQRLRSFAIIKYFFSSLNNLPFEQSDMQSQKRRYLLNVDRKFSSRMISAKSQSQLSSMYFNRRDLNPVHHSIALNRLVGFYNLSPPKNYLTKQLSTIINTIQQQIEDFDPNSLISVLSSFGQFPRAQHEQLLPLQDKIMAMLVDEQSLAVLSRINILKFINVCRKINVIPSRHQLIVEVIKVCLKRIANSISKLSTVNVINLINIIHSYQIVTKNILKSLCRQAVSRIKYLSPAQMIVLLKGVIMSKNKELLVQVFQNLKIQKIKEYKLSQIFKLRQLLCQIGDLTVKQLTGSSLQDFQKYTVEHSMNQYREMLQKSTDIINLPLIPEIISLCEKHDNITKMEQLNQILSANIKNTKIQNRLHVFLYQMKHDIRLNRALLKTTQNKSKPIFPLIFLMLVYDRSLSLYEQEPTFKFLVDLSLRYFIHNITKYKTSEQLKRCKYVARLLKKSPSAFEVFLKQVGKYLVEHTRYSQQQIKYMWQTNNIHRYQSYHEAFLDPTLDVSALNIMQKMSNAVNLMYYTISIFFEMNIDNQKIQTNKKILQQIKNQFLKNFKLGHKEEFMTLQNIQRLNLILKYFDDQSLDLKILSEQHQKPKIEVLNSVVDKLNLQGRPQFNVKIKGVDIQILHKNIGYILTKNQLNSQLNPLEKIILEPSNITLKFITL